MSADNEVYGECRRCNNKCNVYSFEAKTDEKITILTAILVERGHNVFCYADTIEIRLNSIIITLGLLLFSDGIVIDTIEHIITGRTIFGGPEDTYSIADPKFFDKLEERIFILNGMYGQNIESA